MPKPSRPTDASGRGSRAGSALPIAGEGPGADAAIQRVLETSWPADLPPGTARRAVAKAWKLWRADVTGTGDAAAHSRYTRVRKQAAIARRADGGRVQVHLVWAGAGPDGKQREGRTVRILLDLRRPDEWKVVGS
ncbi:hypothetical protein [Streptomyces sp. 891-h]|uniref:hypothetical protein n=1 Tax=Streptomyces sp. 891-h TaxID=2720714 RepID=UPI001FAA47DD|nr:hypothetical protein [Streptomyces sp. 891-h]UNZ21399.1 hypothetical protein HC362_34460 [Streptomyces sp. 891-h]